MTDSTLAPTTAADRMNGASFFRRITTDYLYALVVVAFTLVTGVTVARLAGLEVAFFPIPLWALWWLFLLELFNILRILYEERRNLSGIPLVKIKTAVFLFYPVLSGCWMLSPWVLFQHNKVAANLAISAYGHYWSERRDIDRAFDSAMILYYCTREPTFLHAIADGVRHGSDETAAKARTWFLRVLGKPMGLPRFRLPEVEKFMISPLLQAAAGAPAAGRPAAERVHRRIQGLFGALVAEVARGGVVEGLVGRRAYQTLREKVAPGGP